jgi:DNA-binding response OmpR family regulator
MGLFTTLGEMRILLVDGNEWVRDSLTLLFEAEGCHVLALETGDDALVALNTDRYDILISDYRLPDMDGLELFVLAKGSHPHAMKILVTAYGDTDIVAKGAKAGVDGFLQKPLTMEALKGAIRVLIEKRSPKKRPLSAPVETPMNGQPLETDSGWSTMPRKIGTP